MNEAKRRSTRFNNTTGVVGYMTKAGPRGGNHHPDRCVCQGDETTPHKHYPDAPFSCARCVKCQAYRPAVPILGPNRVRP